LAKGDADTTIDHDKIRKWVEDRGGRPAEVRRTGGNRVGLLRINFPGYGKDEDLVEITWEDFFDKFEEKQLAFVMQEETASGQVSRFNKLIGRKKQDQS
jgi:hypothetical protein